ncbi:hypothetical protein BST81_14025 [Leptolyngbya sp. 'hensonii']|uniref:tetratricopeptide repeat protein n=1 Tax=Leptolyngbya sp. 'hensonii' TaxID=1922337 RepID=UPI0009501747|nr:tetratricopeptide repeat protein [Leptolyngbya sp. 'hensonii']OLP18132.1 hypothetical protein BST81_14025 [Leptolyngbya sp. 'hensonii']
MFWKEFKCVPILLFAFGFLSPIALPALAATTATEYRELGLRYRNEGQFPAAIAAFQKSVKLDPKTASGWVLLGWTQHLATQEKAAAESLVQAIRLDSTNVPAFNALGIVYLVQGDLNWTLFTHRWALLLQDDNEIAYYNLSLAYERLKSYKVAIDMAQKAAKLEPSNPHPLVAAAIAHLGSGDRAAARESYRQAIALESRYRDRAFLAEDLKQAGFSSDQIQRTEAVLDLVNESEEHSS